MNLYINKLTLSLATLFLFSGIAMAKENVGSNRIANGNSNTQRVVADCDPAEAQTDLAINNVRFRVLTGGDMWWDANSNPIYEVPKVNEAGAVRRHSIFAGALWIGGIDGLGNLKVAAQTYRQTGDDFWPGALNVNTIDITPDRCDFYDRHWIMNKEDVLELVDNNGVTQVNDILTYPGNGDGAFSEDLTLAPFFDNNADGIYDLAAGDYPGFNLAGAFPGNECNDYLFGDAALWWVFNDKGNDHTETNGSPIGLEIRSQAFAFATNDEINNMTFYKYQIVNRSNIVLNETYFGQWVDPDLGNAVDDYVGCDVNRGLGFCYNGDSDDDGPGGYGLNPPAVGVDFFQGPLADTLDGIDNDRDGVIDEIGEQIIMSKFVYYNNVNSSPTGNPDGASHFYNYLKGIWGDGQPITYGGDGRNPTAPICNFMFPDDTDPDNPTPWNEVTAGNVPADRRFLQSAGPFTLQPGAVNYITVGVVWARATTGGATASINLMKLADDKAQALFDNCFAVLDCPDAPDVAIRELNKELVITLYNTNNEDVELYAEIDPTIPAAVQPDSNKRKYYFQGYQIYQMRDGSTQLDANDLDNVDRYRLVAQSDIQDSISQIVNYTYDESISAYVPKEMVLGENSGLKHSIRITQDAFATGDPNLINHKTYYYSVLSYAYNNYKEFNPSNPPDANSTQGKRYCPGRRNIKVYSGIPHNPIVEGSGTILNVGYGSGPNLKRIEGQGNGGLNLELTKASIEEIMSSPFHISLNPVYKRAAGPANVRVIDPLGLKADAYMIKLNGVVDTSSWEMQDVSNNDTVFAERTISVPHEQLIPQWGMSSEMLLVDGVGTAAANGFGGGIIDASITYSNNAIQWLNSIPDIDGAGHLDWILAGTETTDNPDAIDPEWEGLVNGTWAPYKIASEDTFGPQWAGAIQQQMLLSFLNSVDIVITSDKSKWTRSPVVEMGMISGFNQGGANKGDLRTSQPSIDKNGRQAGDPGYNMAEGNLTKTTGMGWFPGYAINIETGERLNIAYGENSSIADFNGQDMKWNPTSDIFPGDPTLDPIFGGGHYIFIFDHNGDRPTKDIPRYDEGKQISDLLITGTTGKRDVWKDCIWTSMPILNSVNSFDDATDMVPPSDVTIKLRVAKNYELFVTRTEFLTSSDPIVAGEDYYVTSGTVSHNGSTFNTGDIFTGSSTNFTGTGIIVTAPENKFYPMYTFENNGLVASTQNIEVAKSALDLIKVVPNPYYAYSTYETSSLDNRVKITNVPANCTVSIYNVNGTLVKRIKRALGNSNQTAGAVVNDKTQNLDTSIDWDLKNESNIPVSSGIYIIHIDAGAIGEKTVKWFGVMRPIDLTNF